MPTTTDRIIKHIVLRAPRERVWAAIADAASFGTWFGVKFDGAFAEGVRATGRIVPTAVDPLVATAQQKYVGLAFEFRVEQIEPMHLFSFCWHPFAIDPAIDYSHEPMTLVVFELADAPEGTAVTITESGFDSIPLARRADAFEANEEGWSAQTSLLEKYLAA